MVRPTTGRPCCWRSAATAEESTPPDIATAIRPRWVSARLGNLSNWVNVIMFSLLYRATSPFACAAVLGAQHPDKVGTGAAPLQSPGRYQARDSWVGSGFLSVRGG